MTASPQGSAFRRDGHWIVAILAALAIGLFAACSDDEENGNGPIVPDDDASDVTEPIDGTSDSDTESSDTCTGSECPDGTDGDTCEGDACEEMLTQCDEPIELGTLTAADTLTADDQLPPDAPDELSTQCSSDDDGPGERVFRFTSDEDLQVSVETSTEGSLGVVTEVRRDWCRPAERPAEGVDTQCASGGNSFFAPADSTWYVVVERSSGIGGDFDLTVSGEQACDFGGLGDSTCAEGTYSECVRNDGGDIVTDDSTCPTACGGDACEGSSCSNAIVISGDRSVSGPIGGFSNDLNLSKTETSCPVNGVDVDAAGPDLIFLVESTSPGETIQVTTSPQEETFYGYVTKECPFSPMMVTCRKTWDSDGEFVVPEDGGGDYYIIIDRATVAGSSDFTFDFTRQGP